MIRHSFLALALLVPAAFSLERYSIRPYPIITDAVFTADDFILDQARFWYAIYTDIDDDEGLIHDPFHPELVFGRAKIAGSGRAASRAMDAEVDGFRKRLLALAAKDSATWDESDRELKSRFPYHWDSTALVLCAERVRFQRGLKSKFRAGLERSYRYLPTIDSVFSARGLPTRLKFLPHVESSFYPHAYSKVGAAGMWQFMKSTGRKYMKVGYLVDERRDPHVSTEGAARMLAYNFSLLKSWPLALVAYNHGPGGVMRAVRGTNTSDLSTIIKSYYSNTFGFASKNFYGEFLAASSIALQADSLFPDLRKLDPLDFQTLVLAKACPTKYLCALAGMTPSELEEYNLSLRPATFRGNAQLPKGFALRLPRGVEMAALTQKLGSGEGVAASAPAPGRRPAAESQALAMAAAPSQDKVEASPARAEKPAKPRKLKPAEVKPAPQLAAAGAAAPEAKPSRKNPETPGFINPGAPSPTPARRDTATMAGALAAAQIPPPTAALPRFAPAVSAAAASARASSAPEPASEPVVDSNFALQAADLDKLAHPMDRFNPAIYNLGHAYEKGQLLIKAGTEETFSHYSDWSGVLQAELRRINRIGKNGGLALGRSIRIPVDTAKARDFLRKREEYYRAMEEDFYGSYYVAGTEPLRVQKGMNLWTWSQEKEVPFWLLQKHNPGKALNEVKPGDTLSVPLIETGIRKWGFTRYGNSREYLAGISRYLADRD